jgi:hypothetical protein
VQEEQGAMMEKKMMMVADAATPMRSISQDTAARMVFAPVSSVAEH